MKISDNNLGYIQQNNSNVEVFYKDGEKKVKFKGIEAKSLDITRSSGNFFSYGPHVQTFDYKFQFEIDNITYNLKRYSANDKGCSNYQRPGLAKSYDDWVWKEKLYFVELEDSHYYLINPDSAEAKVMEIYKYSSNFFSYVDPEFVKSVNKSEPFEYMGIEGKASKVMGGHFLSDHSCIALANGQTFSLGTHNRDQLKYFSNTDNLEGLKVAIVPIPEDHALYKPIEITGYIPCKVIFIKSEKLFVCNGITCPAEEGSTQLYGDGPNLNESMVDFLKGK